MVSHRRSLLHFCFFSRRQRSKSSLNTHTHTRLSCTVMHRAMVSLARCECQEWHVLKIFTEQPIVLILIQILILILMMREHRLRYKIAMRPTKRKQHRCRRCVRVRRMIRYTLNTCLLLFLFFFLPDIKDKNFNLFFFLFLVMEHLHSVTVRSHVTSNKLPCTN